MPETSYFSYIVIRSIIQHARHDTYLKLIYSLIYYVLTAVPLPTHDTPLNDSILYIVLFVFVGFFFLPDTVSLYSTGWPFTHICLSLISAWIAGVNYELPCLAYSYVSCPVSFFLGG